MWGIDVVHPVTGVAARIAWRGHAYVDGQPVMVRVDEFCTGLSRSLGWSSYPKRLDVAIARARRMIGDYDCANCGQAIHWIPEPHRVYVHNHNATMVCDGGRECRGGGVLMGKPKLCTECKEHTIGADIVHWRCHDTRVHELENEVAAMGEYRAVVDVIDSLRAQWLPHYVELSS